MYFVKHLLVMFLRDRGRGPSGFRFAYAAVKQLQILYWAIPIVRTMPTRLCI